MHGGLSPDLNSMEQIRRVMRPTDVRASSLDSLLPTEESGFGLLLSFKSAPSAPTKGSSCSNLLGPSANLSIPLDSRLWTAV